MSTHTTHCTRAEDGPGSQNYSTSLMQSFAIYKTVLNGVHSGIQHQQHISQKNISTRQTVLNGAHSGIQHQLHISQKTISRRNISVSLDRTSLSFQTELLSLDRQNSLSRQNFFRQTSLSRQNFSLQTEHLQTEHLYTVRKNVSRQTVLNGVYCLYRDFLYLKVCTACIDIFFSLRCVLSVQRFSLLNGVYCLYRDLLYLKVCTACTEIFFA